MPAHPPSNAHDSRKETKQEKFLIWVTVGAFISLFLYGFVDNLKGAVIPKLLSDLGISYSAGGTIQQGAYFGFLVATLVTGMLVNRFGHQSVLMIGAACMITGMAVYSCTSVFFLLLFSMIIIGVGLGILDLVGMFLIIDYLPAKKAQFLNLSAFFHGLASMLAPLFAGVILARGFSWRQVYQFATIFVLIFFLYLIVLKKELTDESQNSQLPSLSGMLSGFKERKVGSFYALIFCYEAIEIGYAVWLSEFLQKARGLSSESGIMLLSAFFFCLMAGRLIGSFIVERLGYLRLLLIAAAGAFICLSMGTFGSGNFYLLLPVTGFFLSIIFPTTTAVASSRIGASGYIQMSIFFTFAGLGGMVGSWAIGVFSDLSNIVIGFGSLAVFSLAIAILILFQIKKQAQPTGQS